MNIITYQTQSIHILVEVRVKIDGTVVNVVLFIACSVRRSFYFNLMIMTKSFTRTPLFSNVLMLLSVITENITTVRQFTSGLLGNVRRP